MKYLILLLISFNVSADGYNWKVIKVLDGDTVKFEAPWVPKPLKPEISVRVLGVDTPEKKPRNKCDAEDALAQKASQFTKDKIANAKSIHVMPTDFDKYGGRILGHIIIDGKSLSDELLENGLAKPYHGEKKSSWCE